MNKEERRQHMLEFFHEYVDAVPGKMSGAPCLKGTRFPVAQLISELTEEQYLWGTPSEELETFESKIQAICDDLYLDKKQVEGFMNKLFEYFS